MSGVGEKDTSTRERPLMETMSTAEAREMPLIAVARLKPSSVTGTLSAGAPLMEISRALPPAYSMVTPGRNFKNSPTCPSATVPNSSVDTTVLRLAAKRCSLIAMAAASISFEVVTTNVASFTRSAVGSLCPAAVSVTSWRADCPAATATAVVTGVMPV